MLSLPPTLKSTLTKLKKENGNGYKSSINSFNHFKKKWTPPKSRLKRSRCAINWQALTVTFAVPQWLLKWGVMGSFTPAPVFQTAITRRPSLKTPGFSAQNVAKAPWSNANQKRTEPFMAVRGILIATSSLGINRLHGNVQSVGTSW